MLSYLIRRIPLALLFFCSAAGIIANHCLRLALPVWFSVLLLFFLGTVTIAHRRQSWIFIAILMFLLGAINHSRSTERSPGHLANLALTDQPDSLMAVVESSETLANGRTKIRLRDISVKRGEWRSYRKKMLLTIKSGKTGFIYGDRIRFQATLQQPGTKRNPGEFDYRRFLANHDIFLIVSLDSPASITAIDKPRFSVRRLADRTKTGIEQIIDRSVYGEQNAILKALIVGVRGEISDETERAFIDSGVIHVLAVSGLHVGYVTLVFMIIFGFLRFPYKTRVLLTIAGLCFYALLVDLKPSVVRAVIMASLILFARAFEKDSNTYNTLAGAALVQTIFAPLQIFDIGFQLSFIAVFSIVYIYTRLRQFLPEKIAQMMVENQILRWFLQALLVSLAALLGTIPITVYYFQRIPIISLLANLIVIPLVGLIGALGFAQVILGSWLSSVNIAYGEVQMILIAGLKKVIQYCSQFPLAWLQTAQITLFTLALAYILIYLILNAEKRRQRFALLVVILLIANVRIWSTALGTPKLRTTFLDVGQGDAIFIELPDGGNMLIDCGDRSFRWDAGEKIVAPYLQRRGIRKIDYLVLTHPHSDHIGGAPYLLEHFDVGELWETAIEGQSAIYRQIHYLADSLHIPVKTMYAGSFLSLAGNTAIRILHPSEAFIGLHPGGYNDYSLVIKMTHGDIDWLFTGDTEAFAEHYIAGWGNFLNSEILKVPHHGSATSSTLEFLDHVHPEYALISVGARNRFRHPSSRTVAHYNSMQIRLHRTDLEGALVIESNGSRYKIRDW